MKNTLIERQKELAALLDKMKPFEKETIVRCAEDARARLTEVKPIVADVVEALEQLRKWENDNWYQAAHAYSIEALVPHTDALFDDAEEAEVLALWFARAYLAKMELMPEAARWEELQDARALLLQAGKALGDFLRREAELPEPAGV
ncbi:hypothetical protein FE782_20625 [Paenibacillus antri]|uniref:Uncharacterized protein n=1 Tax=Paenibacillus antri TaxID=2582848 RepID=A0A5R9G3N1_9BACL|nr:hypothetical protein [Paenibacillus antri]TLS50431.1 hypothetical protein FE782_20625 [Paenibacillus antri]